MLPLPLAIEDPVRSERSPLLADLEELVDMETSLLSPLPLKRDKNEGSRNQDKLEFELCTRGENLKLRRSLTK